MTFPITRCVLRQWCAICYFKVVLRSLFPCFHSNAFRGRVTSLRSLQLTAEFHLLSIHCTQEGVGNRVRVRCSIYWVYGVHRDIYTRAAKVVCSMGPQHRPRRKCIMVIFYATTEVDTFVTAELITPLFYVQFYFRIIKLLLQNCKCTVSWIWSAFCES